MFLSRLSVSAAILMLPNRAAATVVKPVSISQVLSREKGERLKGKLLWVHKKGKKFGKHGFTHD